MKYNADLCNDSESGVGEARTWSRVLSLEPRFLAWQYIYVADIFDND